MRSSLRLVAFALVAAAVSTLLFLASSCGKARAASPVSPAPGPRVAPEFHNVADYGAKADDTISDQDAFESAVAAAGLGGTVYVPMTGSGAFLVDSIGLMRGQTLLGAGRQSSRVRASVSGAGSGVKRMEGLEVAAVLRVSGLSIEDFEIGIDARGVYESHFEDLDLRGNSVNIQLGNRSGELAGSTWLTFDRIKMSEARVRDLWVNCTNAAPVNLNRFSDCQFETTHSQPVFAGCGGNGHVANSFIGNEFKKGITFVGVASVTVQGNYFEGGDKQLEFSGSVLGANVAGNYFHDWGEAAVYLSCNGVRGVVIAGNSFWGPEVGAAVKVANVGGCSCGAIRLLGNTYESVTTQLDDQAGCSVTL